MITFMHWSPILILNLQSATRRWDFLQVICTFVPFLFQAVCQYYWSDGTWGFSVTISFHFNDKNYHPWRKWTWWRKDNCRNSAKAVAVFHNSYQSYSSERIIILEFMLISSYILILYYVSCRKEETEIVASVRNSSSGSQLPWNLKLNKCFLLVSESRLKLSVFQQHNHTHISYENWLNQPIHETLTSLGEQIPKEVIGIIPFLWGMVCQSE